MNNNRRLRPFLLLAALTLTACASREEAARNDFARRFTCPAEQVTTTKIPGVRWSEVRRREHPIPDPPAEVRADPARLDMWNRQNDHFSAGFDHNFEGFHVTGCGHEADLLCQCAIDTPVWKQFACPCEMPTVPLLPPDDRGKTR